MIKYIFYWITYTSSVFPQQDVSGTMVIYQDSVRFYTHADGYQTLPIVATERPVHTVDGTSPYNTVYLLKKDDTFVTIMIHPTYIEYSVKNGIDEYIRVKRKNRSEHKSNGTL